MFVYAFVKPIVCMRLKNKIMLCYVMLCYVQTTVSVYCKQTQHK
jgi:hypothetical protein